MPSSSLVAPSLQACYLLHATLQEPPSCKCSSRSVCQRGATTLAALLRQLARPLAASSSYAGMCANRSCQPLPEVRLERGGHAGESTATTACQYANWRN